MENNRIKETLDEIKTPEQLFEQTKYLMFQENEKLHNQVATETIEEKPTFLDNIKNFFANKRNTLALAGMALAMLVLFVLFPANNKSSVTWNNTNINDLYVKDVAIGDGNEISQEEFESVTNIAIFPITKIDEVVDKQFSQNEETVNAVINFEKNKTTLLISDDKLFQEKYEKLEKTAIDNYEVSFMKDDGSSYALWNKGEVWFLLNSTCSEDELLNMVKSVIDASNN